MLTVEKLASSSKVTVSDLGKLLNYDFKDGVYKIRISAVDGAGRETFHTNNKKEYYEFRQDTTAPNVNGNTVRVNCIFPPNNDKCDVILTWDPVALEANGSGIDYYEVSIRPLVGANGGNEEDWYTEKVTDTKFQYSFANDAHLRYEFKIVAVDKAGNIGKTYYSKDTQEDGYILQVDGYANELTSENLQRITLPQNDTTKFEIKNENVGGNDLADCFVINNNTSGYLDIYVKNIESIVGSSKQLTIEVFTADNLTKAFKTYTVKAGNLIATDLYLEAGNEYYFRIKEANASAVTSYYLEFTKDDKTVTFNTQGDTEETTGTLGQLNTADYVKIDVTTKGRYSFNVIGANVKFTIFKVVDGKMTSVGSVTGTAAGKTLSNVILEAEGEYYYQVVPTSTKVGVDYTYTVESTFIEAFPMDNVTDGSFETAQDFEITTFGTVSGVVSCDDKFDFYKLDLAQSGSYNFTLNGNGVEPAKLTVYKLVGEKLVSLGSLTVKAGTTSATFSKDLLLDNNVEKVTYYIEVQSTSAKWGSEYTVNAELKTPVGGYETNNESWEDKASFSTISVDSIDDTDNWVGFNDLSDCRKVELEQSGIYQFTLGGVSQNTVLNVYEEVDGSYNKLTSITVKANAATSIATKELMLELSENKNYYVEVCAPNANVLGTNYQLGMIQGDLAVSEDENEADNNYETLSIQPEQSLDSNWVGFNDISDVYKVNLDRSGEYNFELTGITENAVVTVYDADFNKLTSVTVKAGKSDTTKNLILSDDDNRPYYVEVTIANQKVLGTNYTLSMNTIGYAQGEEDDDDVWVNAKEFGVGTTAAQFSKDWIGYNDSNDYFLINKDQSGIYNFTLSGVSENAVLTIYELVDKTTGELKKVTSLSVKAYNNGTTKDLMFDLAKTYYAEVTISNKKVLGTTYTLSSEIVEVANGEAEKSGNTQTISAGQVVKDQWVGFNDNNDRHTIVVDNSGSYNFGLSGLTENAVLTIYDSNNKKLTSITVKAGATNVVTNDLLLLKGNTYYAEVTIANKKVLGTQYSLSMSEGTLVGGSVYEVTDEISFDESWDDTNVKTLTTKDTINQSETVTDWVGFNDTSDYRKIEVSKSGMFDFTLDTVNDTATVTIYQKVNGKLKKLASATGKKDVDALLKGLLLEHGNDYYAQVSFSNSKALGTEYTLSVNTVNTATSEKTLDEELNGSGIQVLTTKKTINQSETVTDWVGFNDTSDYRKIEVSNSGIYNFTLDTEDDTATVAIYEIVNGKLKKLASATGKADIDGLVNNLFLEKGKEYYAQVSFSNSKALGTDYNLSIKTVETTYGEKSSDEIISNNLPKIVSPSDSVIPTETEKDWVGFNDTSDYREIVVEESGIYNFGLSDLEENAILTIYDSNYKKLTSITVKAGATDVTTNDLMLVKGNTYYVEVTIANKKAFGTEYTLSMYQKDDAKGEWSTDDDRKTLDLATDTIVAGTQITDDWVGFNDTTDWRVIDLASVSGKFDFDLAVADENTILNIYEVVDGNVKKLTSVTAKAGQNARIEDLMLDGSSTSNKTYYAEVVVANKNAFGTTYDLSMNLDTEVKGYASADDNKETATDLVASTQIYKDWVGFNDVYDYRNLVGFTTGEGTLTLTAKGNVTLTVFDESGKKLASISTTASKTTATTKAINFVEGTNYYIEVKSSNATAFGTQYDVSFDANLDTDFEGRNAEIQDLTSALVEDQVGNCDTEDIFKIVLDAEGELKLNVETSVGKINLALYDSNGRTVNYDIANGTLTSANLAAGDYFLRVTAKEESSEAQYKISLA